MLACGCCLLVTCLLAACCLLLVVLLAACLLLLLLLLLLAACLLAGCNNRQNKVSTAAATKHTHGLLARELGCPGARTQTSSPCTPPSQNGRTPAPARSPAITTAAPRIRGDQGHHVGRQSISCCMKESALTVHGPTTYRSSSTAAGALAAGAGCGTGCGAGAGSAGRPAAAGRSAAAAAAGRGRVREPPRACLLAHAMGLVRRAGGGAGGVQVATVGNSQREVELAVVVVQWVVAGGLRKSGRQAGRSSALAFCLDLACRNTPECHSWCAPRRSVSCGSSPRRWRRCARSSPPAVGPPAPPRRSKADASRPPDPERRAGEEEQPLERRTHRAG